MVLFRYGVNHIQLGFKRPAVQDSAADGSDPSLKARFPSVYENVRWSRGARSVRSKYLLSHHPDFISPVLNKTVVKSGLRGRRYKELVLCLQEH